MIKSLSKLQKALLSSAIEILKPNGEIVYSTCTHAPEENEEVVDFVLNKFKGEIKLEKISLPVKCREGITEWNISNEKNVVVNDKLINSSNKTADKVKSNINNKKISEQSEPNLGWASDFAKSHQRQEMGCESGGVKFNKDIKKTCRVYPQDNNTEGFFLAKFRKIK